MIDSTNIISVTFYLTHFYFFFLRHSHKQSLNVLVLITSTIKICWKRLILSHKLTKVRVICKCATLFRFSLGGLLLLRLLLLSLNCKLLLLWWSLLFWLLLPKHIRKSILTYSIAVWDVALWSANFTLRLKKIILYIFLLFLSFFEVWKRTFS